VRAHDEHPPKPRKATVASFLGSILATFLPTHGEMMIARMPTGAVARPAQVAV
jgi:hypothetical protein